MPPDATVFDALKLMADENIGSVLVMEGDLLVGILSERDYARKVILHVGAAFMPVGAGRAAAPTL